MDSAKKKDSLGAVENSKLKNYYGFHVLCFFLYVGSAIMYFNAKNIDQRHASLLMFQMANTVAIFLLLFCNEKRN